MKTKNSETVSPFSKDAAVKKGERKDLEIVKKGTELKVKFTLSFVKEGTELVINLTTSLGIHATAKEIAYSESSIFALKFISCSAGGIERIESERPTVLPNIKSKAHGASPFRETCSRRKKGKFFLFCEKPHKPPGRK